MKRTIQTILTLAALFVALPCPPLRADDAAKPAAAQNPQLASLQGTWEGTEEGQENSGKCTLTIHGNSLEFQGWNKDEWYKGTFELPAGASPLQMEATIKDCPAPQMIGQSTHVIYKIEDGTFTLTGNQPGSADFPKSFVAGGLARTFTFKKKP